MYCGAIEEEEEDDDDDGDDNYDDDDDDHVARAESFEGKHEEFFGKI